MKNMEDLKFNWDASLQIMGKDAQDPGSMIIAGELVNASVCANNFALDEAELPKVADQVKNAQLRVDHSKSARDVIGGFRLGKYEADKKRVMFEAEVDDPQFQRLIAKGRLRNISIGATADAFCSKCGKSTKPFKTCSCKGGHEVIKNIKLKEASIITEPAYTSSEFQPIGFLASIESALKAGESVTPSSKEEARPIFENKMEEERKMSEKKEEVAATTLKPAGADAIVVLGNKLEALAGLVSKMEERFKKQDEDEAKKKKDEDEAKKKDDFASIVKSEFANLTSKLEALVPKKEDSATFSNVPASKGIPKDVKHEGKKEPAEEEEEDEPKEKVKKEGAKVESASETQVEVTADAKPAWFKEIEAYAKKNNILD